ncbi:TetR/AcrR family transcriptional regulator [Nocardia sp. BSTN01]|uniref:TetR/AcrR family transcriptional regulator n=1 Tax=Nocardia sp. BSTN01 TaxID=2783665 RepID=UPI00188FFE56|nr:TetR/AcrR family transcriptional regulator [Nocardia sp. BSTN01]MBF5000175.1 TetR/AcrR family transcriptional regulator [Nocardia sp. BSTN01]
MVSEPIHPDSLRADARSNRDHLLLAALDVFAERGTDVPMKLIADRAGVGVGTLYRRFPDRDALVVATAQAHLDRLARMAGSAGAEEATAWDGLRRFLRECALLRLGALAAAIEPAVHAMVRTDTRVGAVRAGVLERIDELIRRAQQDGDLRTDVGVTEVGLLMTVQVYAQPGESYPAAVDRVLAIVFDGLRPVSR